MPSFSSVDWTDDGVGDPLKMHAHRELITGVLKHEIGFGGFVISDWEGIHQLPGDYATQGRTGVNAGIDMFMEPSATRPSRPPCWPRSRPARSHRPASTTPSGAS
jgi:beta-glucosidase